MFFWDINLDSTYGQIILYLQLIVAIFLAVHVLLYKQDPQSCLGWLLATASSPLVALVFYLGVGINPFAALSKKKNLSRGLVRKKYERSQSVHFDDLNIESLGQLSGFENTSKWITYNFGLKKDNHGICELLINSDQVYLKLFSEIRNAKKYILVQFYQIQADEIGFSFLDSLAARAEAGIKVYVIFDALGSFSLKTHMIDKYRKRGVNFHKFLEIHPLKRRFQVNWRNHRKLVVIDGEQCFVGGFNIGSTYLQGSESGKSKWVDLLLNIRGDTVGVLSRIFIEDWHFATGQILDIDLYRTEVDQSEYKLKSMLKEIRVIPSGPSDSANGFYSTLLTAIYESRKKIQIMTPYFVPDRHLMHALNLAVRRGVDVSIVVPRVSNHPFTDLCSSSYFSELYDFKIKVFRYKHGVCHAKVTLMDDDLILVGSSNMDYRSFFLNFETDLLVRDKKLFEDLTKFFDEIIGLSSQLTEDDLFRHSLLKNLPRRVMRLIAPLM